MKKFTIIFSILLVLAFVGTMIFVAVGPDFEEPAALAGEGEDPNAPVWEMTMDDLITYLAEKGLVDPADKGMLTSGIATEAYIMNGLELYWWDLENISRDSDEFKAYEGMREQGIIDLWGQGMYFMSVTKNGPFGINASNYEGDIKALMAAYEAFGH